MFFLTWAALLFAVRGSKVIAGSTNQGKSQLCDVILCYSKHDPGITPKNAAQYTCEQNCTNSNILLRWNKIKTKVKPEFRGRVSVSKRNCSFIITNFKKSESNTVEKEDQFQFQEEDIDEEGLIQKPTVEIPPLTEGQQATLTCTAPGLCSGSAPEITWTWRGRGEKDSNITGIITAFKTENLTAVTQRHSSTLTFNSSAEHHGSSVTCKVSFKNNITIEKTVTLNVTYVREPEIIGETTVKEGDTLNLTCSVNCFPSCVINWPAPSLNENLRDETGPVLCNGTLVIFNVTRRHTGQYICRVTHENDKLNKDVNVNVTVTYIKKPEITGNTSVQEGDTLNLTCNVESFPPSDVVWTDKNVDLGNTSDLVIHNVTAEHAGKYICTVKHMNITHSKSVDVTVLSSPKILNITRCTNQSDTLTCVCVSRGFPLPTIEWPLLRNYSEYSVTTTVSNHTVSSNFTLTVRNHSNITVECVSENEINQVRHCLSIKKGEEAEEEDEDEKIKFLRSLIRLEILVAFLMGTLLSSVICCLAIPCCRKKQRPYENGPTETLEMVTQEGPLIDAGQPMEEHNHGIYQEAAGPSVEAGKSEVEYSNLDFSLIKSPDEAVTPQSTTETEYAEIKKENAEGRQAGEGREEEVEGEDEEAKHCILEEEEGEETPLYSTVKDVMD